MANIAFEGGFVRRRSPSLLHRMAMAVIDGRARKGEQEAASHLLALGDETLRRAGYNPASLRRGHVG